MIEIITSEIFTIWPCVERLCQPLIKQQEWFMSQRAMHVVTALFPCDASWILPYWLEEFLHFSPFQSNHLWFIHDYFPDFLWLFSSGSFCKPGEQTKTIQEASALGKSRSLECDGGSAVCAQSSVLTHHNSWFTLNYWHLTHTHLLLVCIWKTVLGHDL